MTLIVGFSGGSERSGPLTWAQRGMWNDVQERRHWAVISRRVALPDGCTLDQLGTVITQATLEFETLRTAYRVNADGQPVQVVTGRGDIEIEVIECAGREAERIACESQRSLAKRGIDVASGRPARFTAVRSEHGVEYLVWAITHLSADMWGTDTLARYIVTGISDPHRTWPTILQQPIDRANFECGESGRRRTGAALRHWERLYESSPIGVDHLRRTESDWSQARLFSPRLDQSVADLSERFGSTPATLLLNAFGIAASVVLGQDRVAVETIFHNRISASDLANVNTSAQCAGLLIEGLDGDFPGTLKNSWIAVLRAYSHGACATTELRALRDAVQAKRGGVVEMGLSYHYRRTGLPWSTGEIANSILTVESVSRRGGSPITVFVENEGRPEFSAVVHRSSAHGASASDILLGIEEFFTLLDEGDDLAHREPAESLKGLVLRSGEHP